MGARRQGQARGAGARIACAVCAALALACLLGLCACRPTDFFTEVIISPFAEEVDEDNDTVTIVNSPDAEEESADLAALSWTDETERSELTDTLVVYSSTPTSALSTRNSIYDLNPLLEGEEASLGVRLLYDADSQLDEQTDDWLDNDADAQDVSESTGAAAQAATGDGSEGEAASGGTASDDALSDELSDGSGSEEGAQGDDGAGQQEEGGYGASVTVYNPGDAYTEVPRVESLAVIGASAAVLAQALGGAGAICAMSEEAYYGADDAGVASSFAEVFGSSGDLASGFEESCLLWAGDGTAPEDLSSVEALVAACGTDGVIVYDQDLGDQYDFFSEAQREALSAAGITLVPVDFSTVQGMLDAAAAIGDALSESSTCAQDASANCKLYKQAVRSIVKGVAAMHGGTLAATSSGGAGTMLTDYNNSPVTTTSVVGSSGYPIVCYVATEVATGWSWGGDGTLDPSGVLLLRNSSYAGSPLAFWGQVAGVSPNYASYDAESSSDLELLWPYRSITASSGLSGSGSAYKRWLNSGADTTSMQAGPTSLNEGMAINTTYGLGSKYIPYLVVAGDGSTTADEAAELVVASIESYSSSGTITGYSALPYGGSSTTEGVGVPGAGLGWRSTIGSQNADGGTGSESPFLTGLSASSVVRVNPCGLLGSWTEGSMECVLEAVWLGTLYAYSPSGCSYEAVNDLTSFSCTIGGYECSTLQEAVQAFYATFYRVGDANLEACCDAAVPDQFEDLQ